MTHEWRGESGRSSRDRFFIRFSTFCAFSTFSTFLLLTGPALWARQGPPDPEEYRERSRKFTENIEAKGLAEQFKGITTDGRIVPGLFPIRSTGVSTE